MKHLTAFFLLTIFLIQIVKADITFGVVPQQTPLKLFKIWQPVVDYLSKEVGVKVHFKTEKNIQEFSKKLYSGAYDMAYMNPMHFVLLNKKFNYEALVRSDKQIRGILVMNRTNSIEKLKDKKLRILFPSPGAFAATVLMKYDLAEIYNLDLEWIEKSRYVNSHDSVYRGIARGLGDVGGGIERTFNYKHNISLHKDLKVVHRSKGYPTHPFAVRTSLSADLKKRLTQALLNMPHDLLKALNMKRLKKTDRDEYKSVQALVKKLNIGIE